MVGTALAWPYLARAQSNGKPWRIGQVIGGSAETNGHFARAFEQRLGELGYRLGDNLRLVTRYANPQLTGMQDAIRSLIGEIDLLVVWATIGAMAAKNVAGSLPVVFMSVGAPVEVGLVQSLSRPGGNMTGITFEAATETYAKRLKVMQMSRSRCSHWKKLRLSLELPSDNLDLGLATTSRQSLLKSSNPMRRV
jgi:putative ABC transport system substrate-binding protein